MTRVAALATFTGIPGMSHSGRLQSSPTVETINERRARNGKYPTAPGRLVAAYIINGLTTGTDPKRKYSILDWMSERWSKSGVCAKECPALKRCLCPIIFTCQFNCGCVPVSALVVDTHQSAWGCLAGLPTRLPFLACCIEIPASHHNPSKSKALFVPMSPRPLRPR